MLGKCFLSCVAIAVLSVGFAIGRGFPVAPGGVPIGVELAVGLGVIFETLELVGVLFEDDRVEIIGKWALGFRAPRRIRTARF